MRLILVVVIGAVVTSEKIGESWSFLCHNVMYMLWGEKMARVTMVIKHILIDSVFLILAMLGCGWLIRLLKIKVHSELMSDSMAGISFMVICMMYGVFQWNICRWRNK